MGMETDRVYLQVQMPQSGWSGAGILSGGMLNNPNYVSRELQQLKQKYPNLRVRAVDENGRLIDLIN